MMTHIYWPGRGASHAHGCVRPSSLNFAKWLRPDGAACYSDRKTCQESDESMVLALATSG
jgi:hypothetical protein